MDKPALPDGYAIYNFATLGNPRLTEDARPTLSPDHMAEYNAKFHPHKPRDEDDENV